MAVLLRYAVMEELYLYIYVTTIGFSVAGLIASLSRVYTGDPLRFELQLKHSGAFILIALFIRIIAGPFLLIRNSIKAARIEGRAAHWLALSAGLATIWSFASGALILETVYHIASF